jgi:hypothetical protein
MIRAKGFKLPRPTRVLHLPTFSHLLIFNKLLFLPPPPWGPSLDDLCSTPVARGAAASQKNSVPQWEAESCLPGQWLPAAGGDRAWAARTGSGPMRMCGDIFAAARLEGAQACY